MYLLKYRSRGKSVQLLQELLNAFDNNLEADGYFGRVTEAAVKEFQQENGLTADGIVYTQSWAKLL
ncbi:MAG: peptidoglycan-binding protein, partial [Saprospiraceae bacterium]